MAISTGISAGSTEMSPANVELPIQRRLLNEGQEVYVDARVCQGYSISSRQSNRIIGVVPDQIAICREIGL
jgi:hypothetical protein